jgi:acyl-CoA oxidase
MGKKTIANDLDNARIHFDHIRLPKSAMLSRFAKIDDEGVYHELVKGCKPFEMVG